VQKNKNWNYLFRKINEYLEYLCSYFHSNVIRLSKS